jgi:serine/threonine protein kinase
MTITTSPTQAPPPVPGFEILHPAGQGGMGEVYVARQLALSRLVAIKFLSPESGPASEQKAARFRREAELMARVSHPNILPVYDYGVVADRPYLVLEYVKDGDLRNLMAEGRAMAPERVLQIVRPVSDALLYLHSQGILHRDLKPENILMDRGEHPKVADFGIAVLRASNGVMTGGKELLGTLGYIAPEQQYRLKVDERADQFSLAALAYELLTGRKPLGVFKPPSHYNRRLRPDVDAVIVRALRDNPKDRYPTIGEFMTALAHSLSQPKAGVWLSRPWLAVAVAVPVVLATSAVVFPRILDWRESPAQPVAAHTRPKAAETATNPATASPSNPTSTGEPKPAPQRSAAFKELTAFRAHEIWKARGSPKGSVGAAVKDEIWVEAEKQIQQELEVIAYMIWQSHGSPAGEKGEAEKESNWEEAEQRLLKSLKEPNRP